MNMYCNMIPSVLKYALQMPPKGLLEKRHMLKVHENILEENVKGDNITTVLFYPSSQPSSQAERIREGNLPNGPYA